MFCRPWSASCACCASAKMWSRAARCWRCSNGTASPPERAAVAVSTVSQMKYLDVDGIGRVSRIGLGTWQFGSREWGYGDAYASGTAGALVRRALELGVTLFDTAEIYGFGRSERILGEALGDQRAGVVVASKI